MKTTDFVREYFPGIDDKLANDVLWECTGFPHFWMGDSAENWFRKQLEEISIQSGGDPFKAIALTHEKMDLIMSMREKNEEN